MKIKNPSQLEMFPQAASGYLSPKAQIVVNESKGYNIKTRDPKEKENEDGKRWVCA